MTITETELKYPSQFGVYFYISAANVTWVTLQELNKTKYTVKFQLQNKA